MGGMETKSNEIKKSGGKTRNIKWEEVRDDYLRNNPKCVMCDITTNLEVHHIYPFHICNELGRPDLELDPRNLITLCEGESTNEHHLLMGHLDSWESFNPLLKADTIVFKNTTVDIIKNDRLWQLKVSKRPNTFFEMTPTEKESIREELERKFPLQAQLK